MSLTVPTDLLCNGVQNPTEVAWPALIYFSAIFHSSLPLDRCDGYRLEVSRNAEFSDLAWQWPSAPYPSHGVFSPNISDGERCPNLNYGGGPYSLEAGEKYWWRIMFFNDPDDSSPFSTEEAHFTIAKAPISKPTNLLCNGLVDPADTIPLYFSGIHHGTDPAEYYQIQVNKNSSFTGRMLWNSGQISMSSVADDVRSANITYNGQALSLNAIKYYWRIKFWNSEDEESDWSDVANFTMKTGEAPWDEDVKEPTGEVKIEIPLRSGQWTTLEDVMRIHTAVTKNPLDQTELAQAEITVCNISKNFNSYEEASSWYRALEGFAFQISLGCNISGTPISEKLFTGIISSVHPRRKTQTAELKIVDFLDYFSRMPKVQTPVWEDISLIQLYKNLVELVFSDWTEGVDYFVEDLGGTNIPAIGYEELDLLKELKNIAESRGKRIYTDCNGKLICRSRAVEGEAWQVSHNYNLKDVMERRDINSVFNRIIVHARPHEIAPDLTPPGKISAFTATPGNQKIDLTWVNPTDDDFLKVKIQFSTTGYPPDRNDGTNIYEGTGQAKSHTGLVNGQKYYYSGFTVDTSGNWSGPARCSAKAGVGGDAWVDDSPPSPVTNFRAVGGIGSISLTWRNPLSDNYDYTYIRADYDFPGHTGSFPADSMGGLKTAYQGTGESKTFTVLNGAGIRIGRRYYFSAFVRGDNGKWSSAKFASCIPRGFTDPGSGTLEEVSHTQSVSGGGCLADQRDISPELQAIHGCFYSGTHGYHSRRLNFSKRGSASNWLKFKIEWDIYNWMSSGYPVPNHISRRERRIGAKDDLSLNFRQNCGIAEVAVSKISESSTSLTVQFAISYTGPKRVGWHFNTKLTLEGRA